jgi:hypothetical protein
MLFFKLPNLHDCTVIMSCNILPFRSKINLPLRVRFEDENGIDHGGLTDDFLTAVLDFFEMKLDGPMASNDEDVLFAAGVWSGKKK